MIQHRDTGDESERIVRVLGANVTVSSARAGSPRVLGGFSLALDIDRMPERSDRVYSKHAVSGRAILYFSLLDGIADFVLHDPRDQSGFGGAVFNLPMRTGETVSIKGPWSSSCEFVNSLGICETLYPATVRPPDRTDRWVSGVTGSVVEQAMRFLPDWRFIGYAHPSDTPNAILSDGQARIVSGVNEYLQLVGDAEVCDSCGGDGSIAAKEGEPGAIKRFDGKIVRICRECPSGALSGYKSVPGVEFPTRARQP